MPSETEFKVVSFQELAHEQKEEVVNRIDRVAGGDDFGKRKLANMLVTKSAKSWCLLEDGKLKGVLFGHVNTKYDFARQFILRVMYADPSTKMLRKEGTSSGIYLLRKAFEYCVQENLYFGYTLF